MTPLVRISWLIAGTLLLARAAGAVVDAVLWHLGGVNFRLPRYPFIPYLHAAALLSVSFAVVSTCGWLIERRQGNRRNQ